MSRLTTVTGLGLLFFILAGSARADFWTENGCVLAKPEPLLKNGGFRIDDRTGRAHESLKLGDGIVVRLEQSHCEYVSRTYTFILKPPPEDTDIIGWQYRKALELLALLEKRSSQKLKLGDERKALKAYADLVVDPKTDVEINIRPPHDQFYELISLDAQVRQQETQLVVTSKSGPY